MSSYTSTEGTRPPQAIAEEAIQHLLTLGARCLIGIALGLLAARLLRTRQLHWSWAAVAGAVVVLAQDLLAGWALTLAVCAFVAGARGRRWHREDLDAGADLARLAGARSRPTALLWTLAGRLASHARERIGQRLPGSSSTSGELQLGLDEKGRAVCVPFAGTGGTHTLVVGATGSGKTVTQSWIAVRAIERHMGAVVLDPKGDGELRRQLRRAALAAGRPFLEWTPDGDRVYNPYARGGASEIADKVLAGERFTEPHYLRQAQRYLGYAVRALRQTGTEISLGAIVEQLDPEGLERLARRLGEAQAQATFAYLDALSPRQRRELTGVRDRLAILAESDVGRWLDPSAERGGGFDLLSAVRSRAVVYFSLQSDSRPLVSQMLGAAIVQDLQTTVSSLQATPVPTLVAIDEFSAIAAEHVVRLFGRARSAGLSLLLGTQELSDLRLPGRERMLEQVLGNLSVLIAHRQVVPSSAELIASVAGSHGAWKVTRHSDGRSTRVRTSEPVLDGQCVMGLGRGWGAVLVLGEPRSARVARMFSPQRGG